MGTGADQRTATDLYLYPRKTPEATSTIRLSLNISGLPTEILKAFLNLGMTIHVCNLRAWEAEAGRPEIQGPPRLYTKFKGGLVYIRH